MMYFYYGVLLLQFFVVYSQEEAYLKANQKYTQGHYDQAALLYEGMTNKGSAAWYNLGNCYRYLERYKDAYIAYTRALKDCISADYPILIEQKAQSYEQWTGHKEMPLLLSEKIMKWIGFFTLFQWQIAFLLLWITLLFSLRLLPRTTGSKVFIMLLSVMVCVLFFLLYYAYCDSKQQGVMIQQTKIFVAPRADVYVVKEVVAGERIIVMDLCKNWTKVEAHGIIGWIQNSAYETL